MSVLDTANNFGGVPLNLTSLCAKVFITKLNENFLSLNGR